MARTAHPKIPIRARRVPVLPLRDTVHFPSVLTTLHVARDLSVRALRHALDGERTVIALSQVDMEVEEPSAADLSRIGTLSEVIQAVPLPDGSMRGVFRGVQRCHIRKLVQTQGCLWAEIEPVDEPAQGDPEFLALARECGEAFTRIAGGLAGVPSEAVESVLHAVPSGVADAILQHLPMNSPTKQGLLEQLDPRARLEAVYEWLLSEDRLLAIRSEIRAKADEKIARSQREFILREQLAEIQSELYGEPSDQDELVNLRSQIESGLLPDEVRSRALHELRRLGRMQSDSGEATVVRTTIDWLLAMPWGRNAEERIEIPIAQKLLDEAHFGLHDVKARVLEHLAVRKLGGTIGGTTLCLVGPPGVGKTSFARAIATALGRPLVSIALGGLRDEAELRGHRRTYVGAMPGKIVQGLRRCGVSNPVILLDEIDKIGQDAYRGDPAGVLLEVLDTEQNHGFVDNYLELPFDLSQVLFVATANTVSTILPALHNRLEIQEFPSYADSEKIDIIRRHILPRELDAHGLGGGKLRIEVGAIEQIVLGYSNECGVRSLDQSIRTICRKAAMQVASGIESVCINADDLLDMLGEPSNDPNRRFGDEIGVALGLVVSPFGGDVLPIEVSLTDAEGSRSTLRFTGNLGEVMKESADAAISYLRTLPEADLRGRDIHVHVPKAAVFKEGPSGGLAIAVAIYSAAVGLPVRADVALTGEITLRGKVLPVGGVREKILAAHRAGIREVLIPEGNAADLRGLPSEVRDAVSVRLISETHEAIRVSTSATKTVELV